MFESLFGIGTRTVSVGDLEVGDRIRIDSFKNAGQTYNIDATIIAIVPSEKLEDFYWVHCEGTPAELLHVDKRILLLRKGKKS
ncbi:MAG: hypothetical protein ACRC11_18140 [Xenococcaceae cyanobacterium]